MFVFCLEWGRGSHSLESCFSSLTPEATDVKYDHVIRRLHEYQVMPDRAITWWTCIMYVCAMADGKRGTSCLHRSSISSPWFASNRADPAFRPRLTCEHQSKHQTYVSITRVTSPKFSCLSLKFQSSARCGAWTSLKRDICLSNVLPDTNGTKSG